MAWTPGYRRRPPGISTRKVGGHIRIHAMITNMTIRLFTRNWDEEPVESDIEDDTPVEQGEDFILNFQRPTGKMFINLSEFTEPELDALKETINRAIDIARPVVAERDRIAREAIDNGDNPYYRSLRQAPSVSFFKGRTGSNP